MRVVFIVRRYWPLMTAGGCVVDRLARYLVQQGHETRVLTAQVDPVWPESLVVRGVPVQRFGLDAWSLFGRKSLGQRVAGWLEEHPESWDVAVLCDVFEGAELIFRAADSVARPVLVSFFDTGPAAPFSKLLLRLLDSQGSGVGGNGYGRSVLAWRNQRDWLVVDAEYARQIREFQPQARVSCWQLGVTAAPVYSSVEQLQGREALRSALGQAGQEVPDLQHRPWLVCPSHGLPGSDAQWLWEFLRQLCERRSDVVVWLVGDGPAYSSLWRRVHEADLERRVLFPGCYGDLGDLLVAADLVALPQTQWYQLGDEVLALAAGTPCLLSQGAVMQPAIVALGAVGCEPVSCERILLPPQMETWQSAVDWILDHPAAARHQAWERRQALVDQLPQSRSLERFEAVLLNLREVPCQSQN